MLGGNLFDKPINASRLRSPVYSSVTHVNGYAVSKDAFINDYALIRFVVRGSIEEELCRIGRRENARQKFKHRNRG